MNARVLLLTGAESAAAALRAIAAAQKRGEVCALLDVRKVFDADAARANGVRVDSLLVGQPDCPVQAQHLADTLVRSLDFVVIC